MKLIVGIQLIAIAIVLAQDVVATEQTITFANEKEITFTARSGESTKAFEGFIIVPENHNNPDSRLINLAYVRFPATTEKKGHPIVYLSGGPGGSGIRTAQDRRYPLFQALRAHADVIALDQRGTGRSNDVKPCVSSQQSIHTKKLTMAMISEIYHSAANECFTSWQEQGVDIYGYTTVQSAMDLDKIRQHFNAEKVTLWGISYGSHLAMAAAKVVPDAINNIMIASAEGLNQTVKLPEMTDDYFARIEALLNANPDYVSQYPELRKTMHRVHKKLEEKPLSITFNVRGKEQTILFQKWHMQQIAGMVIADPGPYLGILFNIYYQLDSDKTELLNRALSMGFFTEDNITLNLMSLAMDVASGITDNRLQKVNKQASESLLGTMLNFPMPHLNKIDGRLDLGDDFRTDPNSDIPLLLLTGSLDGRTYPASQREAVKGFRNRTMISVENAGHNLFMSSPEVEKVMLDFLKGNEVDDTVINLPIPDFNMPEKF